MKDLIFSTYLVTRYASILFKHFSKKIVRKVFSKIFNINIGEPFCFFAKFLFSFFAGNEFTDENLWGKTKKILNIDIVIKFIEP